MVNEVKMIAFGPVPSRRLGCSLGINNIPPKICTYSCIYCQLGRTHNIRVKREVFYKPEELVEDVKNKVKATMEMGEPTDYLTFVPDGEPTLDINLGKEIDLLKPLAVKIAVITNASLLWRKNVRDELCKADWVSLKVDTVSKDIWHGINRPHMSLKFNEILKGVLEFSHIFSGELTTETMLTQRVNDDVEEIEKVADFITKLNPKKSYIAIPTRPPAEKWVRPTTEGTLNVAYRIFKEKSLNVEYLIGFEGDSFGFTGNVEEDLLRITSVHPMRGDSVKEFLRKTKSDWTVIEKLINEGKLVEVEYKDKKFYVRKLVGSKRK